MFPRVQNLHAGIIISIICIYHSDPNEGRQLPVRLQYALLPWQNATVHSCTEKMNPTMLKGITALSDFMVPCCHTDLT